MTDSTSSGGMSNRGMGRGGLDRYLGPEAGDASSLPPAVATADGAAEPDRKIDCAGSDVSEAVCEIAKAEEREREEIAQPALRRKGHDLERILVQARAIGNSKWPAVLGGPPNNYDGGVASALPQVLDLGAQAFSGVGDPAGT